MTVSSSIPNPCNRNCCLDDSDTCIGCRRHIDEITGWRSLDDSQKRAILERQNKPVTQCVSFILLENDNVLIERRVRLNISPMPVTSLPGGHLERGETLAQALIRETKEELGIDVTDYDYVASFYFNLTKTQLVNYFCVTQWQGKVSAMENQELIWTDIKKARTFTQADQQALQLVQTMLDQTGGAQ